MHILLHIVEDIRRFGPAVWLSTEVFESYNGVFRACSVLSNHQAPSRDIAFKMAQMECFKHIASGGRWKEEGVWDHAGQGVLSFIQDNDIIQDYLGWVSPKRIQLGSVRLPRSKKQRPTPWGETLASGAICPTTDPPSDSTECFFCPSFVAYYGDVVKCGFFIVAQLVCDFLFRIIERLLICHSIRKLLFILVKYYRL